MDVVYVVRNSPDNESLRYSLRSLQNVPHGTVWIVGFKPKWVTNVEYLPTRQNRTKFQNSTANLLSAATHSDVSETFQYWNDDFFALEPATVKVWHRGRVHPSRSNRRRVAQGRSYQDGLEATRRLLVSWGITDPLSYELHLPMIFEKDKLVDVLRRAGTGITALHKRTLYGNYYELGGERCRDVKVGNTSQSWKDGQVWLSTSSRSFDKGAAGRKLRELFPDPSPYEEAP